MLLIFISLLIFSAASSAPLHVQRLTLRNPTLLISLDGFRADKLDQFLASNPESTFQKEFVDVGVKADYMNPSFPSLTFPNHCNKKELNSIYIYNLT